MVFEISRDIAAPIDAVWAAWTDADQLSQWYSPGPIDWVIEELDVRPGGRFHMHMQTPEGEHVAKGIFHAVEAPTYLAQGPEDKSMTIHTRLSTKDGVTHMSVSMEGLPEANHDMMQGAWSAGFDKLEHLLAQG